MARGHSIRLRCTITTLSLFLLQVQDGDCQRLADISLEVEDDWSGDQSTSVPSVTPTSAPSVTPTSAPTYMYIANDNFVFLEFDCQTTDESVHRQSRSVDDDDDSWPETDTLAADMANTLISSAGLGPDDFVIVEECVDGVCVAYPMGTKPPTHAPNDPYRRTRQNNNPPSPPTPPTPPPTISPSPDCPIVSFLIQFRNGADPDQILLGVSMRPQDFTPPSLTGGHKPSRGVRKSNKITHGRVAQGKGNKNKDKLGFRERRSILDETETVDLDDPASLQAETTRASNSEQQHHDQLTNNTVTDDKKFFTDCKIVLFVLGLATTIGLSLVLYVHRTKQHTTNIKSEMNVGCMDEPIEPTLIYRQVQPIQPQADSTTSHI
eukprot:m.51380 g.51380  ORF g.51380 m.51380 type:complete len:378 (-) comp21437_c1_seq1:123-1256(-)